MASRFVEEVVAFLKPNGDVIWFAAFWGFLGVLGVLEALIPAFRQSPERGRRWPTNFSLGAVNAMLLPLVPVSVVGGAEWAHAHGVGLLNQFASPWWTGLLATLAVRSLAGYAVHVLMHKAPLLWGVHRVHHLDVHLDVSTSLRSHPAELVISLIVIVPVAIALGPTPWVLIIYEVMDAMVSAFSHANLRIPERCDQALRWVMVTPNMHRVHHSSYQRDTDSNYGTVFTIWDRVFGTYCRVPTFGADGMQIGLAEIRDERTQDLWWQLKSPAIRI